LRTTIKPLVQIIFVCLSVWFLIWFFRDYDLSILSRLSLRVFLLLIIIRVLNFIIFQLSSYLNFKAFGETVNFKTLVLINSSTTVSNYATPVKAGFPVQVYLLKRMMGISYTKSTAIIFFNLVLSYTLAVTLGIIAIFYLSINILPSFNISISNLLVSIAIFFAVIIFVYLLIRNRNIQFLKNTVLKLKDIQTHLSSIRISYLLLMILLILTVFFVNGWMIQLLINDMSESVAILPLFLIQGIPLLLGSLSMVPMGLGVKDASLTFLLTQLGITPDVALSSALIMRVFITGFSVLLGIFSINLLLSKGIIENKLKKSVIS